MISSFCTTFLRGKAVLLCLLVVSVHGLPALDFSAGGGLTLNSLFISSQFDGFSDLSSDTGFGIRAFADAEYIEISVGLVLYEDRSCLSGSVFVKIPFHVFSWYIFPLAGGEYRYNLDMAEASVFVLKCGIGADIPLTDRLFLRSEILGGYVFLSEQEEDRIDAYESYGGAEITKISFDISLYAGYRL